MRERHTPEEEGSLAGFLHACPNLSGLESIMGTWRNEPSMISGAGEEPLSDLFKPEHDKNAVIGELSLGFALEQQNSQKAPERQENLYTIPLDQAMDSYNEGQPDQIEYHWRAEDSNVPPSCLSLLDARLLGDIPATPEQKEPSMQSFIIKSELPRQHGEPKALLQPRPEPTFPRPLEKDQAMEALPVRSPPTGETSLKEAEPGRQGIVKRRRTPADNLKPRQKKGKFTSEEDAQLRRLVELHGSHDWTKIARLMPTKNRKQLRDRYVNFLNVHTIRHKFTIEEDQRILALVCTKGRKWNLIAQEFPNRSPIVVKNHYYNTLHRVLLSSLPQPNIDQPKTSSSQLKPQPQPQQPKSQDPTTSLRYRAHPPHQVRPNKGFNSGSAAMMYSKLLHPAPAPAPALTKQAFYPNPIAIIEAGQPLEPQEKMQILNEQHKELQARLLFVTQRILALNQHVHK